MSSVFASRDGKSIEDEEDDAFRVTMEHLLQQHATVAHSVSHAIGSVRSFDNSGAMRRIRSRGVVQRADFRDLVVAALIVGLLHRVRNRHLARSSHRRARPNRSTPCRRNGRGAATHERTWSVRHIRLILSNLSHADSTTVIDVLEFKRVAAKHLQHLHQLHGRRSVLGMPFFKRDRRGRAAPEAYGLLRRLRYADRTFDLVGMDE